MRRDAPAATPNAFSGSEKANLQSDWRPKFATVLLICVLVLGLLVLAPNTYFSLGAWQTLVFVVLWTLLGFVTLWRGSFSLHVIASLVVLAASGIAAILGGGSPGNGTFFFLGFVTAAALLWSPRAGAVSTAIAILIIACIAALAGTGLLGSSWNAPGMQSLAGWIGASLAVLLFGVAIAIGLGHMQRRSTGAESALAVRGDAAETARTAPQIGVSVRESLLRKALEVGRSASAIHDPSQLIAQVVDLVATAFGYPFVALFLVNEQGDQVAVGSAAGESAVLLSEQGRVLPLDGNSLAANAARTRLPQQRFAALGAESPDQRLAHPGPRAEAAVPLVVEDRVLGVLEAHSDATDVFAPDELDTLKRVADQVAIALDTARLLETSKHSQEDMRAQERQDVLRSWEPLLGAGALQYDVGEQRPPASSPEMVIPLSLRDEAIGSITLTSETDWSVDERSLVEAVATQAGLALENARLVEVSQLSARREHVLAEITSKVWASTTIEGVLRTALQELGQALGADQATIELRAEHPDDE
jgi:GAF domain-containing protein